MRGSTTDLIRQKKNQPEERSFKIIKSEKQQKEKTE